MKGYGTKTYENKEGAYYGEFIDDKYNGFGVFQWEDQEKYEGYWNNGLKNGDGVWYKDDGDFDGIGQYMDDETFDEINRDE